MDDLIVQREFLRDQLKQVERAIRSSELAPLEHRVTDDDARRVKLARLRETRLYLIARLDEIEATA